MVERGTGDDGGSRARRGSLSGPTGTERPPANEQRTQSAPSPRPSPRPAARREQDPEQEQDYKQKDSDRAVSPHRRKNALRPAVGKCGLARRATCDTLRRPSATHLLENSYDIRTVQEPLEHRDVRNPIIYTHVLSRTAGPSRAPSTTCEQPCTACYAGTTYDADLLPI